MVRMTTFTVFFYVTFPLQILTLKPPLPWATWQELRSESKLNPETILSKMLEAKVRIYSFTRIYFVDTVVIKSRFIVVQKMVLMASFLFSQTPEYKTPETLEFILCAVFFWAYISPYFVL